MWEQTGTNGLPDLPIWHYVNYLNLPAPAAVDVISKIKKYLLSLSPIGVSSDAAGNVRGPETEDRMIFGGGLCFEIYCSTSLRVES